MPVSVSQQIETLYTAHHGWLLSWLRKQLGCSPQTADLTLDVFLRVWVRLPVRLKPAMRRACLWAHLEGLSCLKFACRLGVPLSTAECYLATALRQCYALRFEQ